MAVNLEIPKTDTPLEVLLTLGILSLLGGIFLFFIFSLGGCGLLGVVAWFAILASSTNYYTRTIEGYNALIILNQLTGNKRVLFPGLNFILPWESDTKKVDLTTDLHEVVNETYDCDDARMETKFIYTIRPDYSGSDAGEKIIRYKSFTDDAIKMDGRSCLSTSFSDYFQDKKGEDLRNKDEINRKTFANGTPGKDLVEQFQKDHGVKITYRLEDSDFDEETKKARDTGSRATSLAKAEDILVKAGWDRAVAQKTVRQMNLPNLQEFIISGDIKGLENLQNVTFVPPPGTTGGKK